MKYLELLRNYWYIPLVFVAFVVIWIAGKRRSAARLLAVELRASRAAQKAAEDVINLGADKAKEIAKQDHMIRMHLLKEKQAKRAKELSDDPRKLAKYLARLVDAN